MDALIALCTGPTIRINFPNHRRGCTGSNCQPRQQAAQHTVTHDQIGGLFVQPRHRVPRRCGQGKQRALCPKTSVDPGHTIRCCDQSAGRPTKQAKRILVAIGARHENAVAYSIMCIRPGLDDFADGLIARDQRIAHAGKRRHLSGPEKLFGSGRNTRMGNLDNQIVRAGGMKLQRVETQLFRALQYDGCGLHRLAPPFWRWRVSNESGKDSVRRIVIGVSLT